MYTCTLCNWFANFPCLNQKWKSILKQHKHATFQKNAKHDYMLGKKLRIQPLLWIAWQEHLFTCTFVNDGYSMYMYMYIMSVVIDFVSTCTTCRSINYNHVWEYRTTRKHIAILLSILLGYYNCHLYAHSSPPYIVCILLVHVYYQSTLDTVNSLWLYVVLTRDYQNH